MLERAKRNAATLQSVREDRVQEVLAMALGAGYPLTSDLDVVRYLIGFIEALGLEQPQMLGLSWGGGPALALYRTQRLAASVRVTGAKNR